MPVPPAEWSRSMIDAHWEESAGAIYDVLQELKPYKGPFLARRAVWVRAKERLCQRTGDALLYGYTQEAIEGHLRIITRLHDRRLVAGGLVLRNAGYKAAQAEELANIRQIADARHRGLLLYGPYDTRRWVAILEHERAESPNVLVTAGLLSPTRPVKIRRFSILSRDGFRCRICGVAASDGPEVRLHVDHIIPRSKGGSNDADNLWTLCAPCNLSKAAQLLPTHTL